MINYNYKKSCPICNKKNIYNFNNKRISYFSNKKFIYKIILRDLFCKNCKFIFSFKKPSQNSLNHHYSKKILNKNVLPDYNIKNQINFFKKNFKTSVKIIELGASNNYLIKQLRKNNFICDGYDLDRKKNFKISSYDVILLNHTVEHISSLSKFLRSLYKSIKYGGKLIVEVPDLEKYNFNYLRALTSEHIYHFTKFSLIKLFEKYMFTFVKQEKKYVSRPYSIRLIFEKKKHQDNKKLKKNIKNRKIINNYTNLLKLKKKMQNQITKKIKNIVLEKNIKNLIFWGFNTKCIEYLSMFRQIIKMKIKVVDINYKNIKKINIKKEKIKIENPNTHINVKNFYFICASTWFNEIKKYLLKKKIIKKQIMKIN